MAAFICRKIFYVPACILAIVLVGGCATAPDRPDETVENARRIYASAAARPHVREYAPVSLREAYLNLRRAEEAESAAARDHLAYLAQRQAELAMAVTEKRIVEDEMALLAEERDSLVLQSQRERAQVAEMEAERFRREKELASQKAERLSREAETAQSRFELQSRETQRRESEILELRQELAEFKARETDRGLILTLDSVLFETDRADLKPGAFRSLEKLSTFLKQNPSRNILIEGHTDSTGSAEYNLDLSRRRADAVARALRSQGIQADRIMAQGYGREYPVASNETAEGRLQNRRVEIVIQGETEARAGTGRQQSVTAR